MIPIPVATHPFSNHSHITPTIGPVRVVRPRNGGCAVANSVVR